MPLNQSARHVKREGYSGLFGSIFTWSLNFNFVLVFSRLNSYSLRFTSQVNNALHPWLTEHASELMIIVHEQEETK